MQEKEEEELFERALHSRVWCLGCLFAVAALCLLPPLPPPLSCTLGNSISARAARNRMSLLEL